MMRCAHQEVTEHLSKLEEHQKEMVALREQLKTASEEKKQEEERIQQMQEELRRHWRIEQEEPTSVLRR
ncbi:hypothetical protein AK812_SmicGene12493 [Symbiodinium microadriaticum]|uniref:Reticulocyte-binding protein 2-like a n=1 Tax=Symbiodinium microadriaticum TaxID=2951 RepID=A0A1Q9EAF7_SYMMI|nr:hypothetical protein AK812_SmicGene12493 [Symbiodinium microadriaticum]